MQGNGQTFADLGPLELSKIAVIGQVPDLFREGHSVVVEGFVKPITEEIRGVVEEKSVSVSGKARSVECYFDASEVLAKHDEKYMPAEVANAIEKNKKLLAEEAEAGKKEGGEEEGKEVKEGVAAK
ncbi:cytochrome c-type biogenesis protein CcmE homolog, mitochondrial [Tanacetum coccineum]